MKMAIYYVHILAPIIKHSSFLIFLNMYQKKVMLICQKRKNYGFRADPSLML